MSPFEAVIFVRDHGVVLASGKGPVPSLADTIAGEPIRGSWWSHPSGREIFAILAAVETDPDVLVCRLVMGKITFVHRRLWPALVRVADRFEAGRLGQVRQEHTPSGRHVNHLVAFPGWVPAGAAEQAQHLDETEALRALGDWARTGGG